MAEPSLQVLQRGESSPAQSNLLGTEGVATVSHAKPTVPVVELSESLQILMGMKEADSRDGSGSGQSSNQPPPGEWSVPEEVVPVGTLLPVGPVNAAAKALPAVTPSDMLTLPLAKRPKLEDKAARFKGSGKLGMPQRGANGLFMDIVWTPELAAKEDARWKKECEMARSLFYAVENFRNARGEATLSQVGSDFKVSQLKKETFFKTVKLIDILKRHEDLFDLVESSTGEGVVVKLQSNAKEALSSMEGCDSLEDDYVLRALLPERIEDPQNARDRMQALRVELLHAIARRGAPVALQELGQEPRVQSRKQGLTQAKKLIDFLRLFPGNFLLTPMDPTAGPAGANNVYVEVASVDVSDMSIIEKSIFRNQQEFSAYMAHKGKGHGRAVSSTFKGKGHGGKRLHGGGRGGHHQGDAAADYQQAMQVHAAAMAVQAAHATQAAYAAAQVAPGGIGHAFADANTFAGMQGLNSSPQMSAALMQHLTAPAAYGAPPAMSPPPLFQGCGPMHSYQNVPGYNT
eukprot:TRINITY_DN76820_c0_g1_i1.p1 TRINITY_DN76820_c0_g1~~TRINITY_DN76820_c0_g1_i1.p1  ORF type:complete len:517 (+),score=104.92 TRINITY_DN76820_c0_g1_i1:333-1883(+)